jgi:hypothetical protein
MANKIRKPAKPLKTRHGGMKARIRHNRLSTHPDTPWITALPRLLWRQCPRPGKTGFFRGLGNPGHPAYIPHNVSMGFNLKPDFVK